MGQGEESWTVASAEYVGRKRTNWQFLMTHENYEELRQRFLARGYIETRYDPVLGHWPDIRKKGWRADEEHKFFSIQPHFSNSWAERAAIKRRFLTAELAGWEEPQTVKDFYDLAPSMCAVIAPGLNECWIWTANSDRMGYGKVKYDRVKWPAHRLIYTLLKCEIPKGAILLHSCDNRLCVNPHHLTVGTVYDNNTDAFDKGRNPAFEKDRAAFRERNKGKTGQVPYWEEVEPTLAQIRQIRILYHTGQSTIYRLAKEYDFSRATVARIVNYQAPITANER